MTKLINTKLALSLASSVLILSAFKKINFINGGHDMPNLIEEI